ncbi:MAG TPA: deoxyribonuclease IV [Thermoleophilaceae bacterium]|nr:deoxyribonuclease IV [Thermoleophilaceae bacterium]
MLIGAHVSTAGGLVQAHERAVERGCEAMQVWGQSPRAWRPTRWKPDDVAAFRERMADGPIASVTIHAIYLINAASTDADLRKKSAESLIHALRTGDEIGADGVVLHPGSAKGEPNEEALPRVAELVKHALDESGRCRLLFENTAGAGDTLGRSFEELGKLVQLCGRRKRVGICLDSCHMLATGFDITTADKLAEVLERFDSVAGLDRLRCLHMNDSRTPLGSNRDRHAPPGDGHLGPRGCAAFLSEPRFEGLPTLFEGPGVEGKAAAKVDIDRMKELRRNGLRSRKRRGS